MDTTLLIPIAVALFVGALAILLFTEIIRLLRKIDAGHVTPTQDLVIQALLKWLMFGVVAGERIARGALMDFDTALSSVDQEAALTRIYALIPNNLSIGKITIPIGEVKLLVPLPVFIARGKDLFAEVHAFLLANENYLTTATNTTTVQALKSAQHTTTSIAPSFALTTEIANAIKQPVPQVITGGYVPPATKSELASVAPQNGAGTTTAAPGTDG